MVYCAGPFQLPEPIANIHRAIDVAEELESTGLVTACVPHLNMLWDLIHTHSAEWWYDYDLAYLARCDALLRISGPSRGADNEVEYAQDHGIPVFYNTDDLKEWARDRVSSSSG